MLADSDVTAETHNTVILIVENHGLTEVRLDKGTKLGTVMPVEVIQPTSAAGLEAENSTN